MASNSAVVMPMKRCCLERIQRYAPPDCEGEMFWCRDCGNYVAFWKGAWKLSDTITQYEWTEFHEQHL